MKKLGCVYLISILALIVLPGCDKGVSGDSLLRGGQSFTGGAGTSGSNFNNKIDILFVINDQPSMSSFQQELVTSMSSFMNTFQTKGFDFKIAVVTSSGYLADPTLTGYTSAWAAEADFNDYNGTVHSNMPVILPSDTNLFNDFAINAKPSKNTSGQDGRAFSSMRQALKSARPINAGFLRPDSFLAVIIVDNQDDFSGNGRCNGCNINQRYNAPTLDSVQTYVDFLNNITGTSGATARYNVSAMTQTSSPCQGGTNMVRIMDLVQKTNGTLGNICDADFGPAMAQIASKITLLSTQYFLDRTPIIGTIEVTINGAFIPEDSTNGWTYDSAANSIQFHGSAVPAQDSFILVNFEATTTQ
jgi:hypothetical protein